MKENKQARPEASDPTEANEQVAKLMRTAFSTLSDRLKVFGNELTEFNEKRREVERRIERGAKRTSGRII